MSQAVTTQVVPKNGVHLTVDDVKKNIIADGNSGFFPYSFLLGRPGWLICDSPFPSDEGRFS